jgi:hypothetical protein
MTAFDMDFLQNPHVQNGYNELTKLLGRTGFRYGTYLCHPDYNGLDGYTTDVLLLRNSRPDLQFCRSLEIGVITMNNDIIGKVGALHDMRIEDDHISAVIQNRQTILPNDVIRTIRKAAK